MNYFRILLLCLLGLSSLSRAEDIDLYSANAVNTGVPNVLLVLDNAANFSASAGNCTYVDGSTPSLNGTAGGIEQCAIYNVVSGLPAGAVNLGLMAYNANNMRDINNANCGGSNGGCLMQPLALMSGTAKTNFLAWVKSWKTTGGAGDGYIKANGEATGATMQEAWAYYAGRTGLSGRSYAGVQPTAGCQKNFVIFIGNAFDNSGTPGDGGSTSPQSALASAPGVTSLQLANITIPSASYGTSSFSCGAYTMKSHTDPSGLYADEWARYMYQTDLYGSLDESQGITTYTVGLLGTSCKPDFPALLTSMAKVGGGKYFATSSYDEIASAILKILNEIQAVNSVFSSASLPVSVNAQGTYLNQIFLGMFRPDASANPRWIGNLKQYEFMLSYPDPTKPDPNTATLQLADSVGASAISTTTGFITPGDISFWTSKDTSKAPDSTGGFYVNDQRGAGLGFDSPDGELVEKGGAAQQSRLQNLTADFAATAASSSNPRRLYTYCPSGSGCVAALTDSSNAFSVSNINIGASAFGTSNAIKINSMIRTGSSALVTTAGNHGFVVGSTVTIAGATPSVYNVTQTLTAANAPSGNTFSITGLNDYPNNPSLGTYTASLYNASGALSSTASRSTSTPGATETVTVTTSAPHGYLAGDKVTLSGLNASDGSNLYGASVISVVAPGTSTFSYSIPIYPVSPSVNAYQAVLVPDYTNLMITSITGSAGTYTVTTNGSHRLHTGQTIAISGIVTGVITTGNNKNYWNNLNGTFVVQGLTASNKFTISIGGNQAPTAWSGTEAKLNPSTAAQAIAVGGISRLNSSGSTTATATVTASNWFGNDPYDSSYKPTVSITKVSGAGANESAYAYTGKVTCTAPCTSLSYTIATTPPVQASAASGQTITVSLQAATSSIAAGKIARDVSGNVTATCSATCPFPFVTGDKVVIQSLTGPSSGDETAYAGTWPITCSSGSCTSFSYGPVTLTPATQATGNMTVSSSSGGPDASTLIKWVRGQDNFGDELGPGGSVTVRPSIHGDVLHSRPAVINYGDSRGVVVYYGANDGVYRAVNGSQDTALSTLDSSGASVTVPPGGELWGLILPEHFSALNRQRINTPELKLSTSVLTTALPKDYFVDGSPGVYQKLNADGSTYAAYLFLTMRRGGRFIYALDVTTPTTPRVLWKISSTDAGFEEMGQSWSRPRVTLVRGYTNPVLVFGAGYDPAEDAEPPAADTMGRGIFVVDAVTGARVWSAGFSAGSSTACTGSATQAACAVAGMNWAIPADISFVDRNNDGKTDRFYAADTGGNVWRVDLEPDAGNTPDKWQVSKLAALGCSTGVCTGGATPRKFFFPPNVVSVGVTGNIRCRVALHTT